MNGKHLHVILLLAFTSIPAAILKVSNLILQAEFQFDAGYVVDRLVGNTKGLGGILGIFTALGVPVPLGFLQHTGMERWRGHQLHSSWHQL